jgi:hypothetical protein
VNREKGVGSGLGVSLASAETPPAIHAGTSSSAFGPAPHACRSPTRHSRLNRTRLVSFLTKSGSKLTAAVTDLIERRHLLGWPDDAFSVPNRARPRHLYNRTGRHHSAGASLATEGSSAFREIGANA